MHWLDVTLLGVAPVRCLRQRVTKPLIVPEVIQPCTGLQIFASNSPPHVVDRSFTVNATCHQNVFLDYFVTKYG